MTPVKETMVAVIRADRSRLITLTRGGVYAAGFFANVVSAGGHGVEAPGLLDTKWQTYEVSLLKTMATVSHVMPVKDPNVQLTIAFTIFFRCKIVKYGCY